MPKRWSSQKKDVCVCCLPFCALSPLCVSCFLFPFSFVEKPLSKGPVTSASRALPPPPPKPKPKAKKATVPPKSAAAAAATTSHKTNEVPHAKKKARAPTKQASAPPSKPTSRNVNREAGEYGWVVPSRFWMHSPWGAWLRMHGAYCLHLNVENTNTTCVANTNYQSCAQIQ